MSHPDTMQVILSRRHWVFDLDGTLTVAVHDFAAIRHELGVPEGSDILGFISSLQAAEALSLHARLNDIEMELAKKTAPAAGAVSLVETLHGRGVRMGVLTRNTRENALRTLAAIGVGEYFSPACVIGRDDALPKPDPDGIHKLSANWGTMAADVVMVGDYLYDLQSGRAAGVATIHVDRTRAFRWPELADIGVVTLEELIERVQGL